MALITAILFILFEAVGEGLLKRYGLVEFIFNWWIQWIIAIALFVIWFFVFTDIYIPTWKLITGFVFVRFLVFDVVWNLVRGVAWNYYGITKLYDRIMSALGGFGWFAKLVCGIVGVCFLIGVV